MTPESGVTEELSIQVDNLNKKRRAQSAEMLSSGHNLLEIMRSFDNDYELLDQLFERKTGQRLIIDPIEEARHPIEITKSLSIVIPSYNPGNQLLETLYAIQESSFNAKYPQKIEVIVVDDGSPKVDVSELIKHSGLSDLNLKVLRQSNGRENKGRYSGVLEASGDIVLFMSQDIVNTPQYIEALMKRHEILDNVVLFGFQNQISPTNTILRTDSIMTGSLTKLEPRFDLDLRIADGGMSASKWLKKGGNGKVLPIGGDIEWKSASLPWGQSISASRDSLLTTVCSTDSRYKGYGLDDEQLIVDLIALGSFIVPVPQIYYHIDHPTRRDPDQSAVNREVFDDNLSKPPKRQNPLSPERTDAQLIYTAKNNRNNSKEYPWYPRGSDLERAQYLFQMGQYEDALALYDKAEQNHKNDVWLMHDRAVCLMNLGGLDESIAYLREAIKLDQNNTWLHSSLATALGRQGDYDACREEYNKALSLDKGNSRAAIIIPREGSNQLDRAEDLHRAGNVYLERGNPLLALIYSEAAIALAGKENQPWALFDKGKALMDRHYYSDAEKVVREVLSYMPQEHWVYSKLGIILEKQGKRKEAIDMYKKALEIDPNNWEANDGLSRILKFLV